jgi:hypothetical protein
MRQVAGNPNAAIPSHDINTFAGNTPHMRTLRQGSRPLQVPVNRESTMSKKPVRPSFDQCMGTLRERGFEVSTFNGSNGGTLVSKYGAAAVLVPAADLEGGPTTFAERPGILVRGQIARLLDRGYQKFIKSAEFEFPATAAQLHAIHQFQEELTQAIGGISLYNQSLGTTSDLYESESAAVSRTRSSWEKGPGN